MLTVENIAVEDGISMKDWTPTITGKIVWLIVTDNDRVVGICKIGMIQLSMFDFHPYAIGKVCNKWQSIVKCFLKWIYENGKINKVIALIGVNHKTTYRMALKSGFKKEGLITKSYIKDGAVHDQYLMGLTRDEIGELI